MLPAKESRGFADALAALEVESWCKLKPIAKTAKPSSCYQNPAAIALVDWLKEYDGYVDELMDEAREEIQEGHRGRQATMTTPEERLEPPGLPK